MRSDARRLANAPQLSSGRTTNAPICRDDRRLGGSHGMCATATLGVKQVPHPLASAGVRLAAGRRVEPHVRVLGRCDPILRPIRHPG